MFSAIVDLCVLCLTDNEILKIISSQDSDGIVIEEKCRFVLNEHVNINPEVSYICVHCLKNLNDIYNFKQLCLQNIAWFNNYVEALGTNKHLKVTITDLKYEKDIEPTCDNKSPNEIFPAIEVVLVKEEIFDDNVMQANHVLEEEEAMHQDGEFSRKEKPEDINNGNNSMQYNFSLFEKSQMEDDAKKVKETETKVISEVIYIKDEPRDKLLFEATDSDLEDNSNDKFQNTGMNTTDQFSGQENSETTNKQYSSSLCEDRHIENFLKEEKKETEFKVMHEEIYIKDEQVFESTDSDSEDNANDELHNRETNTENISTSGSHSDSNNTSKNTTQLKKKSFKPHKCDVCNKIFTRLSGLRIHKFNHTGEKPYKCNYCNKAFTEKYKLVTHKRIHTGENLHKCDECEKLFTSVKSFNAHKRIHTMPYECDICHKAFSQANKLQIHKYVHTEDPAPYKCDVCKKICSGETDLKIHKRIHTGEKPYECDVCQKSFNYSCTLVIHKRVHTGESPYKCDVCNKVCSSGTDLTIHKRIHTGEKPYKCVVCKKTFAAEKNLKRHTRVHTGERPYECNVCQKAFRNSSGLVRHKRLHILQM